MRWTRLPGAASPPVRRSPRSVPGRHGRVGRSAVPGTATALVAALALTGCGADLSGPLGALTGGDRPTVSPSGSPSPSGSAAPSSPTPGPSAPTRVLASPSASLAVLVPPDLAEARGYAYSKADARVVTAFRPVAAGYAGVLSAPTVRAVRRGDTPVGSAAAMTVEPTSLQDPEVVTGLLNGLVRGMTDKGYTLRTRQVDVGDTERDVVVAFKRGSTIASWLHDGAVVAFVTSQPEQTALAYARAYLDS